MFEALGSGWDPFPPWRVVGMLLALELVDFLESDRLSSVTMRPFEIRVSDMGVAGGFSCLSRCCA